MSTLIVVAKQCVPGRVKTRLTPPLSPEGAALVAATMLDRTLATAAATAADRRVLFFDGEAPPASAADWEIRAQPAGELDARLAAAFDAATGRTLLIGMDTPQVDTAALDAALLDEGGAEAWFGPTRDGGFWALGLEEPDGALLRGVPMSRADTGRIQRARLVAAGLRIRDLDTLTDVDDIEDALAVATAMQDDELAEVLRDAPRLRRPAAR